MLTQEEFEQILQRVTKAWSEGNVEEALSDQEHVLSDGNSEMKGQYLFYAGMIHEKNDELDQSKEDWLRAVEYVRQGTYLKYSIEENLGRANEKLGNIQEALIWYRHALRTCAEGTEFSGNRVLSSFLNLTKGAISEIDQPSVAAAVEKSWRVLEVPGIPNLRDLHGSINTISAWFSSKLRESKK